MSLAGSWRLKAEDKSCFSLPLKLMKITLLLYKSSSKNFCWIIWKVDKWGEIEVFHLLVHPTDGCESHSLAKPKKNRSSTWMILPAAFQGLYQEARLEAKQLGLELAVWRWDVGIPSGGFILYITTTTPVQNLTWICLHSISNNSLSTLHPFLVKWLVALFHLRDFHFKNL